MNEVILQCVVEVIGADDFALEQTALDPADLATALLVDQQPRAELLGLDLEETGELLEVHGGVQLQVRADGGVEQGVLDLVHENGGVVVDGVDVDGRVVKVRRSGTDELGAGGAEEFLEQGKGLRAAVLETGELVAVLLAEGGVDGVVEAGGVQGNANGDQGVHLVVLLGDGIVAVAALLEVLGARDVDQDVAEHADGVAVPAHHHVREAHVVVGREVGGHHAGEHGLLVHLDVVEGLEGKAEVTQQAVDTEQSDDREVSEHLVQRAGAVLASEGQGVLAPLDGGQLLIDLRTLDKGVQDVENRVAAPCVGVLPQELCFLLVGTAAGDTVAVAAERLELVDEFVDDIPSPVILYQINILARSLNSHNTTEQSPERKNISKKTQTTTQGHIQKEPPNQLAPPSSRYNGTDCSSCHSSRTWSPA